MHTFQRNSSLFSIITLLCTLNIVSLRLVGLRSWIQKLDKNELKEIDDACGPKSKLTVKNVITASGPKNRIIEGKLAAVGKYPFASVFIFAEQHKAKCGGTFISPRHLLTARHCFSGKNESFPLLAGGVCHFEDIEDNCPNMDMVELNYELIIFDGWADDSTFGDIAILQLTESVTKKYPGKISFACLPMSTDAHLPMAVDLIGWGRHEDDLYSYHLREALVPVLSVTQEYFSLAEPIPDTPNQGSNHGDSGSGGIDLDLRDVRVLWGVIVNGWVEESNGYRRTLMMKTSYYLDDFCHYIGLCSPTQGFKNVFGLRPKLNLNGVYLPQGQRSGIGKSVAPFKQISTEMARHIQNECNELRALYPKSGDPCKLPTLDWSMIITNTDNTILCDAVAVTDQHLITSRECIVRNVRKFQKSNIFVRKRHCSGSDECVSRTIDFISWSFSHPLAIVQLVDSSKIFGAIPACFLSSKENRMDMSEGLRGYGTVAKVIDDTGNNRNKRCRQSNFFCAKSDKKCDQEPLSATSTGGYGILDVGSMTLAGIKIRELYQDNFIDVYWRTDSLIPTLCIYLGRCDGESYSFLTKVSYFNNFYFMKVSP